MKTPCTTCGGFGTVTYAVTQVPLGEGYFRDEVCPDCEGMGEIDDGPLCPFCDGAPDELGYCHACREQVFAAPLSELKRTGTGGWL